MCVIGSVLLHIGIKLPDIKYGLQAEAARRRRADRDPVEREPAGAQQRRRRRTAHDPALSRRGLLVATGAGIGTVVVTTSARPSHRCQPLGLLATRRAARARSGVPVNKTATQARCDRGSRPRRVGGCAWSVPDRSSSRSTTSTGSPGRRGDLPDHVRRRMERRARTGAASPCSIWSNGPAARRLTRARRVTENRQPVRPQRLEGRRSSAALLATHLNGERLDIDHGYPLRLIAPNRAGRAEHQVADADRGELTMRRWRIALACSGIALGLFGVVPPADRDPDHE